MTEDHVLEIANKADELIEIIKNIKKNVKSKDYDDQADFDTLNYGKTYGEAQQEQKDPNSWW
jgi:3-dehydroquinate synthetase